MSDVPRTPREIDGKGPTVRELPAASTRLPQRVTGRSTCARKSPEPRAGASEWYRDWAHSVVEELVGFVGSVSRDTPIEATAAAS